MNYHLKSKQKYEPKTRIFAVVSLFIVLNLFGWLFPNFTRNTAFLVAKPLWSASVFVLKPFESIKDYFIFKSSLIKANQNLEEELRTLRLNDIDRESLSKENEELKRQLGRNVVSNRVISRVLSKPPRSPYDTLIIDVGTLHNISIGSKVYSGENIIIGKITEVTNSTSVVELFTKGDLKQESILLRTGSSFTLVGRGGANFGLEVPKDTDIQWGDVFVYPGFSSYILGTVYYIDISSQGSFKTVYLRIPGNIFSTQWVSVE